MAFRMFSRPLRYAGAALAAGGALAISQWKPAETKEKANDVIRTRKLLSIHKVLEEIRTRALQLEAEHADDVKEASKKEQGDSARNLLHYLALREVDLGDAQALLADLGLSSLGRCESHVLANVDAVLLAVSSMLDDEFTLSKGGPELCEGEARIVDAKEGHALLQAHSQNLLGPRPQGRSTHIMVTMSTEAATDAKLVQSLVEAGMDIMRVNCAHDGPEEWTNMIKNLARARTATGKECRVLMDLGGPKLRTGELPTAAGVVHLKATHDQQGNAVESRVWLYNSTMGAEAPPDATRRLPIDKLDVTALKAGEKLELHGLRGKTVELTVMKRDKDAPPPQGGVWASVLKSTYVETGSKLCRKKKCGRVADLPREEVPLVLKPGDRVVVTDGQTPVSGEMRKHQSVPCTLPEVFADIRPTQRIFFDDGKIGGIVRKASPTALEVEITQAPSAGVKLHSDKGINLPDSKLRLSALTEKDLEDLDFAARNADMIGMSFVRTDTDVDQLVKELEKRNASRLGVVLKIETQAALENLPRLLLRAMRSPPIGVMVARGDLAVEIGFERLAEAQEEVLWMAEAAHTPVIWATQVLDTLARTGTPTRAEVTDASMGVRAECVMLNKGPFIVDTVKFLDKILARMQAHQQKKRQLLRRIDHSHPDSDGSS